jgi:N-acetylglucosamine-6-phosphate deacetylase
LTTTLTTRALCAPSAPVPGWLVIDGPVVADAGTGEPSQGPRMDLGDALVAPGFLDLQVNGLGKVDFATAGPVQWRRAGSALVTHGTTGYCPTLVSAPLDSYEPALDRAARAFRDGDVPGVLGVHLEGPFLGGAPGAHPPALLRPAEPRWLRGVLGRYPGLVRIVTLAPEADPGFAATRLLADHGVAVALGHSTASYAEARVAADAGATVVTHLFNGMGPFHHRQPGLPGAALDDDRLTPTLIADLVHVHPALLRLAIGRKRNIALVSDAVAVDTENVGGVVIAERDGAARLPDGTLAGSTLTMDSAVRNVVGLGVPVARAVEMASTIPAEILGLADRGRLAPGTRADIVALDPVAFTVRAVWLAGELVYGEVTP